MLPFGKDKKEAVSTEAPVIEVAAYRVDIEAPGPLKKLLTAYLDISRFQNVPVNEGVTEPELARLIAATPAQARALLETEGYFNAEVVAERVAPGAADGALPVVAIRVKPGPVTRVAKVAIGVKGELQQSAEAGDARAFEQREALRSDWSLDVGKPFEQSAWSSAKNGSLARLRAKGYAAATWDSTQALVDAPKNLADLSLTAESGPLYRLGPIQVEGLQRYKESAVRNMATFGKGSPYTEKALLDYQERLQRSNLFEGVAVELEADPATAKAAPVRVTVRELPLQQASVGIGYSDQTGQRLTVEHTHRRVFGRSFFGSDWIAKNKFELGRDRQSWEGDLLSHPVDGGWRNLLGANLQRQLSVDSVAVSTRVRAGRSLTTERIDRLVYGEALVESNRTPLVDSVGKAFSGNYNFIWRNVDSILLPTRGVTFSAETAAGYALSNVAENGVFGRGLARVTYYRPVGDWYTISRLQLGQVFANDAVGIPDVLQFRAGGDDSVRGYAYRSLGPVVNGVVTSGRVMMTGSAEIARPVSASLPAIWGATFIDIGNAATAWSELRPRVGYGIGVRVRSPIGPLKVDLAYGHHIKKFRLHLTVGVTF